MICAWCGKEADLCEVGREDGVAGPRPCKPCLIENMQHGSPDPNPIYYLEQLIADPESQAALRRQYQERKVS